MMFLPSFAKTFISYQAYAIPKYVKITERVLIEEGGTASQLLPFPVKLDVIKRLAQEACVPSLNIGGIDKKLLYTNSTPAIIQQISIRPCTDYWVSVANLQGARQAIKKGAQHISFSISSSKSITNQLTVLLAEKENIKGLRIRANILVSSSLSHPKEEEKSIKKIADLVYELFLRHCDEMILNHSAIETKPEQISKILHAIQLKSVPLSYIGLHSNKLEHIAEALSQGVRSFDSCLINWGKQERLLTEDLIQSLHSKGYTTGIELSSLLEIRQLILENFSKLFFQKIRE